MRGTSKRTVLGLERLESREVPALVTLSAGVLRVEGSGNADLIEVTATNRMAANRVVRTDYQATVRDAATGAILASGSYNTIANRVLSLRVDALGGNDTVKNQTGLAAEIRGGDGADRLFGGSGVDILFGGAGDDVLVSLGGGQRDVLWGQGNQDTYWLDAEASETIADLEPAERALGAVHRVAAFRTNTSQLDRDPNNGVNQDRAPVSEVISRELGVGNLMDPAVGFKDKDAGLGLTSFRANPLFPQVGPGPEDIRQGQLGDCYFLSTLGAAASIRPERVRQLVADLGDGTYAVHFHNANGTDAFIRVDGDLWTDPNGNPFYAKLGRENSTWVAILEKAWAFHRHNQSSASISRGGYDSASNERGYYLVAGEVPLDVALGMPSITHSNGKPENAPAGNPTGIPTDSDFQQTMAFINRLRQDLNEGKAITLSASATLDSAGFLQTIPAPETEKAARDAAVGRCKYWEDTLATMVRNNQNSINLLFVRVTRNQVQGMVNAARADVQRIDSQWAANGWSTHPTYRNGEHVYMVVSVSADNKGVELRNPHDGTRVFRAQSNDLFFTCRSFRSYTVA
ncbi:MAG: C2 family cysteine protease [Gemmataceae bacterium]